MLWRSDCAHGALAFENAALPGGFALDHHCCDEFFVSRKCAKQNLSSECKTRRILTIMFHLCLISSQNPEVSFASLPDFASFMNNTMLP